MGSVTSFRGELVVEFEEKPAYTAAVLKAAAESDLKLPELVDFPQEKNIREIMKKYEAINYLVEIDEWAVDGGTILKFESSGKSYDWDAEIKSFADEMKKAGYKVSGMIDMEGHANPDMKRTYVNTSENPSVVIVTPKIIWPEPPFEVS